MSSFPDTVTGVYKEGLRLAPDRGGQQLANVTNSGIL